MIKRKKPDIWSERHRPTTLDELGQQESIKHIADGTNGYNTLPHLLLHGPPGVGKTTTALAICKKCFWRSDKNIIDNEKIFKERTLILNASDERGIQFVRDEIKTFAQNAITKRDGIPNFKIIILDESDAMTDDSQFALRRILENYSCTTRFIMICNYISKIIPPIKSRTSNIRYKAITLPVMENIIDKIIQKEKLNVSKDFIAELRHITKGDMRKSINLLEYVYHYYGKFDINNLRECAGLIKKTHLNLIITKIMSPESTSLELLQLINDFKNESYISLILLENLFDYIVELDIRDKIKAKLIMLIVHVDKALNTNAEETIQLYHLFMNINNEMSQLTR